MSDASTFFTRPRKLALAATALAYLAGAAAIYAFMDAQTLHAAVSLPLPLVATLLALSLCNYAIRAWRWVVLGARLGLRVPVIDNLAFYLAGFSLTSTPGKAGEAIRLWFLKAGHGVPYERSLPLMLADRFIDMWAVLILTLASFWGFSEAGWHAAALVLLMAGVSFPVIFPERFRRLVHRLLPSEGAQSRWKKASRALCDAMVELASWRSYGVTLIPTVLGWLAECAALLLLLRHFGADVTLLEAIFVFSFSIVVGAVSMLPGGLGSTEATMVVLLTTLGVPLGAALAVTAIIRITTFWFAVLIGVVVVPSAVAAALRSSRQTAGGPAESG